MDSAAAPGPLATDRHWNRILKRYNGEDLHLGRGEDAASELLRNEYAFLGASIDRPWARRHLVLDCLDRPVGFVHLRRSGAGEPGYQLFEVYLRPPRGWEETFRVIVHTEMYRLYGLPSADPASAYVVPHESFLGYCSQAAIQMLLLNLVPFGGACLGAFDVTRIALGCADPKVEKGFNLDPPRGLSITHMVTALRSPHASVYGIPDKLTGLNNDAISELLAAYVLSGSPAILCLQAVDWLERVRRQLDDQDYEKLREEIKDRRPEETRHAVVVVGCQKNARGAARLFVVHDSWTSPFLTVTGAGLLDSARQWSEDRDVMWVAGVPQPVGRGTRYVREHVQKIFEKASLPRPDLRLCLYPSSKFVSSYLREDRQLRVSGSDEKGITEGLRRRCGEFLWAAELRHGTECGPVYLSDPTRMVKRAVIGRLRGSELRLRDGFGDRTIWLLER